MNDGLNTGQIIEILDKLPKEANIEFDFGSCQPTSLDSYRGYYDELALGFDGSYGATTVTVGQLLNDFKSAIDKTFQGWKGGDYKMNLSTSVFVANPGTTSTTYITGIKKIYTDWYVIITLEDFES